jgi:hypothetical protein
MSEAQRRWADVFGPLVGREIPGGCDDCDAYQTIEPDPEHGTMWHLFVHHDDSCPIYRRIMGVR